ncbi:hypothetical protein CTEN210_18266 [Chaetoceros tenuissimus]|uniref:Uncharacterized protein n=1 Tax=Chaetoceros tenuissimus TaxID=426638 RepID=A0AAD3HFJ4_9STRA|nr:hypothetical protein CTEN210_18266 [Chaetoceros tenuissimus]
MKTLLLATTLLASSCHAFSNSFLHKKALKSRTGPFPIRTSLYGTSDANNSADQNDALQKRTCILNFLTQRSIQSFMFLLKEMKDPHSNAWLANFLEMDKRVLLSYHGTGCLDLERFSEWNCFFDELLEQPEDVVIVEIPTRGGGNCLSKDNPFREKEEAQVREIEIDIDPPSIANRILSVRDKISKEWIQDMDLLISVNSDILSSYAERKKEARGTEDCDTDSDYERGCSLDQEKEEVVFGQRTNQSFERGAIYFINNHQNFSGGNASPLRSSSFDLLFLLTMQEAIHRLLRSYKDAGEEKKISFAWLNELYKKSLSKYFDGSHVGFGRSEEFLDEILSTSPALKTVGDKVDFIDPLLVVEDIISFREEVALEWKDTLLKVELDHNDMRTDIFRKQMLKWGQPMDANKDKKTSKESKDIEVEETVLEAKHSGKTTIILDAGDFQ